MSEIPDAPMYPRSLVSADMPTIQPSFCGPSSASAGRRTSLRNTSSNSASPFIWRSGRSSTPGEAMSIRKNEMPLWGRASASVRAMRIPRSATRPLEHQTFWPSTTHSSPSRTARVDNDARSEPASGSENSWHQIRSPVRIGRRCSACCSGVPKAITAPPVRTQPTMLRNGGTWARAHSVIQAPPWSGDRPWPPCSTGQVMPAKPASNNVSCQRRPSAASPGGRIAP